MCGRPALTNESDFGSTFVVPHYSIETVRLPELAEDLIKDDPSYQNPNALSLDQNSGDTTSYGCRYDLKCFIPDHFRRFGETCTASFRPPSPTARRTIRMPCQATKLDLQKQEPPSKQKNNSFTRKHLKQTPPVKRGTQHQSFH